MTTPVRRSDVRPTASSRTLDEEGLMTEEQTVDVVVVAPVSPACTCCTGCAVSA